MEPEDATRLVDDLFTSWGPFLGRYALRVTRSATLADDLVQEAFLALYRDLRRGKSIENPKSWTLGAVRNQIRKHARYWHRHSEDLVGADALDLIAAEPRWPDVSAIEEESGAIPTGVLTVREEEVILLRLQSLKYREIATVLGISDKSVCTLLARALRKMQAASQGMVPKEAHARKRGGRNAL
jgi:RNA polymerase sigma-70 factor (ECF subfamily)